ncbi:sensor histidine kinase [Butyricicoccus sp.]|uniref:sensor histidine kinase n=1 Tax=Butyricicoccus sp. TaxID=2049021 RepID=UPI003F1731B5
MHSELEDTRAEIGALQSQINPHFLYNTLDAIRGQALIDHSPTIADMTEALSILFRYSISRTGNIVTIQKELYCIEKYMMIQQFRFPGKFEYRKNIDDRLLSCLIPRLTLQPLVENAIYHGLETRIEGGCISISLEQSGEYIVVRISDNGVGMEENRLNDLNHQLQKNSLTAPSSHSPKGSGIALSNVNRRIRLNFGEPYGLILSSSPGLGTDVEIILPKTYSREDS